MNDLSERMAVFVPSMIGGGAERIALNLAGGMSEHGYDVDLVLARAEGPYLAEVPESVRVIDLRASRTLTSLPSLVRYLRRERPQAMLSVLGHANLIALWARRLAGVPTRVVVSVRNTLSRSAQRSPNLRKRLMLKLVRRYYPWADGIVAVSKGVADDLSQVAGIARDRIQVIYNPIVTPTLQAKARASLNHPWFMNGQTPVVLSVGRLTATNQKDYPTLIKAFAQVRLSRSARLLILGEGEQRSKLEAMVKQLGLEQDVSLPGFVANPYPYMAHASVFVLSSRWEGLPGVLIEGLYCGVPVVATDCPSGPREILKDGQYGQLVPVGDANALARAIEVSLEGNTPSPPAESWSPYELESVVSQYVNLLLGS
ncbi:MAG: glycosyltransferase [Chloroflexi bacterium]|nr:glycosyltransferase [Chloroflexota bacterium]